MPSKLPNTETNLVSILRNRVEEKGDSTVYTFLNAGIDDLATLTYRQLENEAKKLASHMLEKGQKGDRALLLFENGSDFIIAFFACLMSGIIAVPAYPPRKNRKMDRLKNIIMDADATLILASEKIASISATYFQTDPVFENIEVLKIDKLEAVRETHSLVEIQSSDIAFLQYSSGSTGAPKGVIISHENIIQNQIRITNSFEHDTNSTGVSWLPYFHDMGLIGGILQPLFVGFPVNLMSPTWFLQKPVRWLKAISDSGATTSGGPNFAWELCIEKITEEEMEGIDLSSWKVAFNGSEPISAQTLREFTRKFAPYGFKPTAPLACYGMAEATLMVTTANCQDEPIVLAVDKNKLAENLVVPASASEESSSFVSSGHTWCDDKLIIVDPETCQEIPAGQVGEIWLKSPSVGQGYWKRSDLNEAVFSAHVDGTGEGPFLRTGDLGFVNDGNLFITGRQKDLIIIRGRNYYPQDLEEAVFNSVSSFSDHCTAAFTVPTKNGEGIVVVQEVKRTQLKKLNVEEAIRACATAVAEKLELTLHDVVLIKPASIAKTSSGKIQRSMTRQMYLDKQLHRVAAMRGFSKESAIRPTIGVGNGKASETENTKANVTELTKWICDNIAEVLEKPSNQIDIDANFFTLGLDSAVSVSFMTELSERVDRELSPTLIYDNPTIRKLVNFILTNPDALQEQEDNDVIDRDIAIVGMSCRFPGSDSPEEFWNNLLDGQCHISAFPQSRAYGADIDSAVYSGGFLDDIANFDNEFFSITGKEAPLIDPQHRLILELSEEVMRNAGYHPPELKGSDMGVFIGIGQNDYMIMGLVSEERHNQYSGTGIASCMAANRVSYFYDFIGPSMAIDTACSAALVAIHEAVKSIRAGECASALVGSVKLIMFSQAHTVLRNAQMLSPDGQCFAFDDRANGYVRGEGAGMVMLKPLNKARADGDNILAIIKGTASNQDGKSNGISAPNGLAQQRVIHKALKDSNVPPQQVKYVEAHGTGTALGDPIEVHALSNIYGIDRKENDPLLVGSVKANVGHLEHAAGMVGLLKAVQCLRHSSVPAQINFNTHNKHIPWNDIAIDIPKQKTALEKPSDHPLYVGVSSFGFGGSNAHLIIQQGDKVQHSKVLDAPQAQPQILALSSRQAAATQAMLATYAKHLETWQHIPLQQLCWRLNQGQNDDNYRIAVVADSVQKMIEKLNNYQAEIYQRDNMHLAFMYTGQGSQYRDMAKELMESQVVFREAMQECDSLFSSFLDESLLDVIYGDSTDSELLNQTAYTQPAIFAIEYALSQLWSSWGVTPSVVLGHSIGEFAAACLAGVMSLKDAVKLVAERGRLIQSLPSGGSMLAVRARQDIVSQFLTSDLHSIDFAAINGSEALVLSGLTEHLQTLKEHLEQQNIASTMLTVSHAFHSKLMQPVLSEFRDLLKSVELHEPKIPYVSCVTGQLESGQLAQAEYWMHHIEKPVLFEAGLQSTLNHGANALLEIGPSAVLAKMAKSQTKGTDANCYYSLERGLPSSQEILQALAWLYAHGADVQWGAVNTCPQAPRLPLPYYPYQKKSSWITLPSNFCGANDSAPLFNNTLGSVTEHLYKVDWRTIPMINPSKQNVERQNYLLIVNGKCQENMRLAGDLRSLIESCGKTHATIELADGEPAVRSNHYQIDGLDPEQFSEVFTVLVNEWGQPQVLVDCSSVGAIMDENTSIDAMYDNLVPGCFSSLMLVKGMMTAYLHGTLKSLPHLVMVTEQAQLFEENNTSSGLVNSTSWGLIKVVVQEYPELVCKSIDLQAGDSKAYQAKIIFDEVCADDTETQVAYQDGERKVARLCRIHKNELSNRKPRFNSKRTYLITGGLGALALKTARWMLERGAKHITLMARRQPREDEQKAIDKMVKAGAKVELAIADVSNELEVAIVINAIQQSDFDLAGIIHTAGLLNDMSLQNQTVDSFTTVMSPKVKGSWLLHKLTRDIELEIFVMLSSAASLFGSAGQANYAAANSFLDSLAHYRHSHGLPALTLQLGMIDEIGMAANSEQEKSLTNQGIRLIAPSEYIEALELNIGSKNIQIGVVPIEWDKWQLHAAQWLFLENFRYTNAQSFTQKSSTIFLDPELVKSIKANGSTKSQKLMVRYLQQLIGAVSETTPEMIETTVPLTSIGLDSLLVVELQKQLKTDFDLSLPVALMFQSESLKQLSGELIKQLDESKKHGAKEISEDELYEEGIL